MAGFFSLMSIAFLIACMQHTHEQAGLPILMSREPTHWMKTMDAGVFPLLSRLIFPPVGPLALIIRSSSRLVTTSGSERYPSWVLLQASKVVYPVVMRILAAGTTISVSWSFLRTASGPH